MLAKELHEITGLDATACFQTAQRLFALQHPPENPVILSVTDPLLAAGFQLRCAEFGISVDVEQ
jgi:hypothetical protein